MRLCCGWCDFETERPGDMVGHMVASGHGLSDGVKADMVESALPAELERVLTGILDGSIQGEPVEDEETES